MPESNIVPFPDVSSRAPLEQRGDDDLMVLAKAGVRDAFAALVTRYMSRIVHFCAKMTGDARTAEEIAQETWLQIWAARDSYVPEGRFVVLLYTVARNRCRNHVRGARRRRPWLDDAGTPLLDQTAAPTPDELEKLLEQERRRRVQAALGKVPEKLREALLLRFSEGLAYEEIAAVLGSGGSTVRSRVHYGLKSLRRLLGGERP